MSSLPSPQQSSLSQPSVEKSSEETELTENSHPPTAAAAGPTTTSGTSESEQPFAVSSTTKGTPRLSSSSSCGVQWEERVQLVRKYYEEVKGYRVHSGLQFGCELVLYADDPSKVHSDFCVHVVPEDGSMDWRMMQSLVRSMPDLHKTLILANPTIIRQEQQPTSSADNASDDTKTVTTTKPVLVNVEELAFATEHAPFRHRKVRGTVGSQRKAAKKAKQSHNTNAGTTTSTSATKDEGDSNDTTEQPGPPPATTTTERGVSS